MSQSAHTCNAEVSHRGNPPHSNAYVHRTTVHQTGQKTGHRSLQQAVSYSEIPLQSSTTLNMTTDDRCSELPHQRRSSITPQIARSYTLTEHQCPSCLQ